VGYNLSGVHDTLNVLLVSFGDAAEAQAYLHGILRTETLNVEIGRSLVFQRLVDYSVILLFISLDSYSVGKYKRRTLASSQVHPDLCFLR
jgi:hypothetical protein